MLTNKELTKLIEHLKGNGWLLRVGEYDPETKLTDTLDGDRLAGCFQELLSLRTLPAMDEAELKRLEMRVKFGGGNEELDLVQCAALRDILAEVRRLRAENERLEMEVKNLENCDYME